MSPENFQKFRRLAVYRGKPIFAAKTRIGERLGVHSTTVTRWLSGTTKIPQFYEAKILRLVKEGFTIQSKPIGRPARALSGHKPDAENHLPTS